ncbi:MAG: response regulator [Calditrichaeota bacterium]|nr:MAG: response regulator [Calditrichota bacterium]
MEENILIVDDEPQVLKTLRTLLLRNGFHPLCFSDGPRALEYLTTHSPPLVLMILDVLMPEMDGFAFFEAVKKLKAYRHCSVLFLSGVEQEEHIVQALEMGAIDYLVKPVNPNILLSKIRVLVRRHWETVALVNTVMEGDMADMAIEELLKRCDEEKLTGFLKIDHPNRHTGMITFDRGLPEEIVLYSPEGKRILSDTEAFEVMSRWRRGHFVIRRGAATEYPDTSPGASRASLPSDTQPVSANGHTLAPAKPHVAPKRQGGSGALPDGSPDSETSHALREFYRFVAGRFLERVPVEEFMVVSTTGEIEYRYPPQTTIPAGTKQRLRSVTAVLNRRHREERIITLQTSRGYYSIIRHLDIYLVVHSRLPLPKSRIEEILDTL